MRSSIRIRLVTTYVMTLLIVLSVVSLYLTRQIAIVMEKEQRANISGLTGQIARGYEHFCGDYENRVSALMDDYAFISYVRSEAESDYDAIITQFDTILPRMRLMGIDQSNLILRVYSPNDSVRFAETFDYSLADLRRETWYEPSAGEDGRWFSTNQLIGRPRGQYVGFYRTLSRASHENSAVCALFFRESELFTLIESWRKDDCLIGLTDASGRIITSNDRSLVYKTTDACAFDDGLTLADMAREADVTLEGRRYYLCQAQVEGRNNWSVFTLTPTISFSISLRNMWRNSLIIFAVCLAVGVILNLVLTGQIVRRIHAFLDNMRTVWQRNFTVTVPVTGRDEIGQIETAFNSLIGNINQLLQNEYQARIDSSRLQAEKAHAELMALRSEINPHYLINTLETIRMNLVLAGDRRNAHILALFAESFSECMSDAEPRRTLRRELELVNRYFEIQRYCHPDMVSLDVRVPESLQDGLIPPLILQPLVENAVYHGLEPKAGPGVITLTASEREGALRLCVEDDGVGMSPGELKDISDMLAMGESALPRDRYLALRNIRMRLDLLYGKDAGMSIESVQGQGTRVTVFMPLTK